MINAVFADCLLNECLFRMMSMKRTSFAGCKVIDCDFYGSTLSNVAFPATEFQGLGFDQCSIEEVDLSESSDLLIGDPLTLRGVSIAEMHVPLIALRLAQRVGIEVQE